MIVDAIGTMLGAFQVPAPLPLTRNLLPVAAKRVACRNHRGALPVTPFFTPLALIVPVQPASGS